MMQELSMNVLDVAQNSVSAGAALITIGLREDTDTDQLTITIEDNGCGMDSETVARVTDPFYTTRTTRKVGLGVPFLKMACDLTGGHFLIQSTVGMGTKVIAVLGLSSIDRPPIGDMPATITSLIQCNPDRDFVYTHTTGVGQFTADTREFKEVLEGVPLSEPEVAAFIKVYIQEHQSEIQGGVI